MAKKHAPSPRAWLLGMIGLGLAACAPAPAPTTGPVRVTVAPGVTLDLPAPAQLGRAVEAVQLVAARHDGQTMLFQSRLSVTADRLRLVTTDSLGRQAMSVTWGAAGLEAERAPWVPDGLRPENVLADIVLLYWPEAAVRQGLGGADLRQDQDGRQVGEAIAIAWQGDPWSGRATLRNRAWDYELEVRSALVAAP